MILPLLIALAGDTPPDITRSVWKHLPTAEQLNNAYNDGRTDAPDTFDVDLRCRITGMAGHVRCILVSESPMGWATGAKVAAVFTRFAVVDMRDTLGSGPGRVIVVHYHSTGDG